MDHIYTSKDIVDAIAKLKNSRSGNIPTRFFKDSSKYIAPSLAVLFNKSITEGIFPDNLKISRISAIYEGKGTRSNPDHYRAISVLSVIARLFEKLVHNQLFTFLKTDLSEVQSGFKPGFSTETSLLKGELQRQNKLISSERPFKILQNETKIIKIGHAVLEIFNFED